MDGSTAVAEHGPLPAGKHGSHPSRLPRDRTEPHRIDPAMKTVEPAAHQPPLDAAPADASVEQLAKRDDPVLAVRDSGDHTVGWGGFSIHVMGKPPQARASSPAGPAEAAISGRRRGRQRNRQARADERNLIR